MSSHCSKNISCPPKQLFYSKQYRKILWFALIVNAGMCVVELVGGLGTKSLSLLSDALDFAGDALNYGISLAVLGSALAWRTRTALFKAYCMMGWGIFILARAIVSWWSNATPEALKMGEIAILALIANLGVAVALYAFRQGDANVRSIWLCSRNDAIGNVAVMLAAGGVWSTSSAWPDLSVASLMALLALQAGWTVRRQALNERSMKQ